MMVMEFLPGILCDEEIRLLSFAQDMITPFSYGDGIDHDTTTFLKNRPQTWPEMPEVVARKPGVLSYGLSSFGYDIRAKPTWRVFSNANAIIVDPKNFDERSFLTVHGDVCVLPPNSYALAESVETFSIPDDVCAITISKSTYCRCGGMANLSPAEPGWRGTLTIEIANLTPLPLKFYAGEGLAQMLFFRGQKPRHNYRTKKGKYQGQSGITPARLG